MKRTFTSAVLAIIFSVVLFSVESAQAIEFDPPPIVVIHWGQGGSGCDSEFNITQDGHTYVDCDCWDIKEGGSRCYGCSNEEGTWEMCIDTISESSTFSPIGKDSGLFSGKEPTPPAR